MAVRILEDEGLAVAEIAVRPSDVEAGALQRGGAAFERLRRAGAEGGMAETRRFRVGELERIALIVVPAAQKHAGIFLAALGHPHYVDEKPSALLEFRRQ